jgi:hypothetical protein
VGNDVFTGAGCERWQPKYIPPPPLTISKITDLSSISDVEKSYITTLIITGTSPDDIADIKDIDDNLPHIANIVLSDYNGAIPNELFYDGSGCQWLESFSAPEATTIGYAAVRDCSSLQSVNLPEATKIGYSAFWNCSSLQSVNLPLAETIGDGAFSESRSLKSINLPLAETIGHFAFVDCFSLESVYLEKATSIGEGAFWNCGSSLTDITFGAKITSWGTDVFSGSVNTSNITLRLLDSDEYANATGTPKVNWRGYTFYEILGPP